MDLNLRANSINTGKIENFQGIVEDEHIEGKLAGGGIPVEVRASSGSINLNWK